MRMTSIADDSEVMAFAGLAAEHFAEHPDHTSYGDIKEGEFLALRWGLDGDCVLVLKLHEYFEPVNFQNIIQRGDKDA